ncbi:hypothetical protein AURDEDRAFT_176135 [Auricularia subglabra TFB-10046 SS5]|uniref:Complex III subunit 7 n=1 Tax=Auricularia subglabra (strain TFB-10046 / SS5) TaxID=717982 RepID=J0WRY5_AURST|nr:hypothetical protein AURDEDRAFT_176135 [Auricularia subglabra TFB-10046 SS5]
MSGWYVRQAGWRKVGVFRRRVSRLPKQAIYDRSFRIRRAHTDLPESQWTKPEDDVPYIVQVGKEENERASSTTSSSVASRPAALITRGAS